MTSVKKENNLKSTGQKMSGCFYAGISKVSAISSADLELKNALFSQISDIFCPGQMEFQVLVLDHGLINLQRTKDRR